MRYKRIKMDNFERCKWNIRKYNNPAGGDPDYWRDKYAPKKHSKTYLKNKYKPKRHSQKYYKDKYINGKSARKKKPESKKSNFLEIPDLWIIILALLVYCLYLYISSK